MSKQTDLINIPNTITVDGTKIGIGTDSPTGKLTVRSGTGQGEALTISSSSSGGNYVTHKHYSSGVIAYTGAGGGAAVGAGTSNDYAIRAESGSLIFATGGNTERARLDSDGLKFHGDTAAANALNDYEEGTWVPTLGGNAVHDMQTGHYVKVGSLVYASFAIRPTSLGTGSTTRISGLPFSTADFVGISIAYYDGAATNHYSIQGGVTSNYIDIYLKTSAINSAYNSTTFFQNNARIYAQATYRTTA